MIGQMLGPYRILEKLGEGGMGEVYRARDERLGRDVAVKVLPASVADDPDRLRRFEQEARAAGQLAHPNILVVHDVGTHAGQPYLITELLEGEPLRTILQRGPLPVRKALDVGVQVAHGLAAAHERGIVHRDLKPENIFLTRDGVVKLLDFGLAKIAPPGPASAGVSTATTMAQEGTAAGVVLGTVGYMAPEQVRGQPTDARTDLFALGTVLYELVTGRRAFQGLTAADTISAILSQDPPPVSSAGEQVPPGLDAIVRRCLEKRPEDRFQSSRDLAFDLASLQTSGVAARAAAVRPRARRWALVAAAAVAVALAGTALLWWGPGRATPSQVVLDPKRVVIAPFENRTGDAALDAFGTLVPEALAQGASGIGDFAVVPAPAVPAARAAVGGESAAGAQALRQLAHETGAGLVVSGAYYLLGNDLRVQAQLTDAASGRVIHTAPAVVGSRVAPPEVLEKLRQRVLGAVAAHFDPDLSRGLVRWPLLNAHLEWKAGSGLLGGADQVAMRRHYERALDLDPDFFSPVYPLHWEYMTVFQCDSAAAVLQRFEQRVAGLTAYERNQYQERQADQEGRYAEQLRLIRARLTMTPDDMDLKYRAGLYELFVRLPRDSVASLEAVQSSGSPVGMWITPYFLAHAHHRLGAYDAELKAARQGRNHFPDVLELRAREAAALAALGQVAEVDRVVETAVATPARAGSLGRFLVMSAGELRAHGHAEAAERLAARAVTWVAARPLAEQAALRPVHLVALALAGRWRDAQPVAAALPEAQAAGQQWDALTQFWGQPSVYRLGWMGAVAARRGETTRARGIAMQLRDFASRCPPSDRTYWRAVITTQLGLKHEAMVLFEEAVAQESLMIWQADHDPLLEPLWSEPKFRALVRPYER